MSGKPGMVKRVPLAPLQARTRMWRAMRQMRRFSTADLCATAEVSASHAQKYLRALISGEYVRCVREKDSGRAGGHAVFQLLRDTGPHAPRLGKQGLLDPNLQPAKLEPGQEPVSVPRADYERALRCVRACAGMKDPEAEVAALRAAARTEEPA
jgi:hypothetical protein